MSSSEASDSPQLKFVRSWFDEFNKRDVDCIATYLHRDHRRITHPRSANTPVQTTEEWLSQLREFMSYWTEDGEAVVHSFIEAPGKVISHLTATAKTSFGVDLNREMIAIINIITDEDGNMKVGEVEEFTDSKSYLDFFEAIEVAKAADSRYSSSYAA